MANDFTNIDIIIDVKGSEETAERIRQLNELVNNLNNTIKRLKGSEARVNANLDDKITPKAERIKGKLLDLTRKSFDVVLSVKDRVSGVISSIKSKISSAFSILTSPLGFIGMGAFAGGAGALVKASLDIASETEQAQIAFGTMLKNGEEGKRFLADLEKFSIKTPFEPTQLRDSARLLLSYGFTAKDIIPTLKAIGDASSGLGLGAEGINRISLALGQIMTKSKLAGQEMMQLAEAGVPAWRYIANALGVSTQQAMKMSEKGLIPAEKAINAILAGMRKDFGGLTEKLATTLPGLLSTVRGFLKLRVFGAFGEGLSKGLLPLLTKVVDLFTKNEDKAQKLSEAFKKIGKTVGDFVSRNVEKVLNLITEITDKGKSIGDVVVEIIQKMLDKVNEVLGSSKIKEIMAKVGTALGKIWATALFSAFKSSISELLKGNVLGSLFSMAVFSSIGGNIVLNKLGGLALAGIPKLISTIGAEKFIGASTKIAIPIKVGVDIFRVATSKDKGRTITKIAGEWAGALGGAKIGAIIGTAIAPGVGTAVGGAVGGIIGAIFGGGLFAKIYDFFKKVKWSDIGETIKDGLGKIKNNIPYWLGYIAGAFVRGIGNFTKVAWEKAKDIWRGVRKVFGDGVTAIKDFMRDPWGNIADILIKLKDFGLNLIKAIIDGLWSGIKSFWDTISKFIGDIKDFFSGAWQKIEKGFKEGMGQKVTPNVPKSRTVTAYASGGIINRPVLGLVGEKGPEVIIPLQDKSRAFELWNYTGQLLGVKKFSTGGIIGNVSIKPDASKSVNYSVNINNVEVNISQSGNDIDIDTLSLVISKKLSQQIKKALENRA
jgi:tape measure domain-containing protein